MHIGSKLHGPIIQAAQFLPDIMTALHNDYPAHLVKGSLFNLYLLDDNSSVLTINKLAENSAKVKLIDDFNCLKSGHQLSEKLCTTYPKKVREMNFNDCPKNELKMSKLARMNADIKRGKNKIEMDGEKVQVVALLKDRPNILQENIDQLNVLKEENVKLHQLRKQAVHDENNNSNDQVGPKKWLNFEPIDSGHSGTLKNLYGEFEALCSNINPVIHILYGQAYGGKHRIKEYEKRKKVFNDLVIYLNFKTIGESVEEAQNINFKERPDFKWIANEMQELYKELSKNTPGKMSLQVSRDIGLFESYDKKIYNICSRISKIWNLSKKEQDELNKNIAGGIFLKVQEYYDGLNEE